MNFEDHLPMRLQHLATKDAIARQLSFREETAWMRDELKALKVMLAAAIESNGGELRIDDRALNQLRDFSGWQIESRVDRYNRVTILRVAK